jgi:hypothetical protein
LRNELWNLESIYVFELEPTVRITPVWLVTVQNTTAQFTTAGNTTVQITPVWLVTLWITVAWIVTVQNTTVQFTTGTTWDIQ